MNTDRHVTMDSFGDNCPKNWEEIASYLNEKIDNILDKYGEDADYNPDCTEEIIKVWEDYCNGERGADNIPDPIW